MIKAKEKTEKKVEQKKVEVKKVSTFKKKKKVKKNITSGIAYVYSTFNNTIISIADESGNVVSWSSAGAKGFKGSRKSTPYAAQVAADDAGAKAFEQGLRNTVKWYLSNEKWLKDVTSGAYQRYYDKHYN